MAIKFNCPHCKKALSVKDESLAGKERRVVGRDSCPTIGAAGRSSQDHDGRVGYGDCCFGPMPGRHRLSEVRSNSGAVPQW